MLTCCNCYDCNIDAGFVAGETVHIHKLLHNPTLGEVLCLTLEKENHYGGFAIIKGEQIHSQSCP